MVYAESLSHHAGYLAVFLDIKIISLIILTNERPFRFQAMQSDGADAGTPAVLEDENRHLKKNLLRFGQFGCR